MKSRTCVQLNANQTNPMMPLHSILKLTWKHVVQSCQSEGALYFMVHKTWSHLGIKIQSTVWEQHEHHYSNPCFHDTVRWINGWHGCQEDDKKVHHIFSYGKKKFDNKNKKRKSDALLERIQFMWVIQSRPSTEMKCGLMAWSISLLIISPELLCQIIFEYSFSIMPWWSSNRIFQSCASHPGSIGTYLSFFFLW